MSRRKQGDHPLRPVMERPSQSKPAGKPRPRSTPKKPKKVVGHLEGRPLTEAEARLMRTLRGLALVAALVSVPLLTAQPLALVFVGALVLPPVLAGMAAFVARRPAGIEAACGHVLRVSLPLAALLWAVSGAQHALAFPAAPGVRPWWALAMLGLMLLAGLAALQAQPRARVWHGALSFLGGVLAVGLELAVWYGLPPQADSWSHLALSAGAGSALAVALRPLSPPASLGAVTAALAFVLLDARRWL